ncbi:GerAB/ArcD/ProY family transporter, partial [Bacillus velezensis]|uniref:GerAB/ArcD/ProY family transporter n=1 Tax=Bacillus velezensis TaxID=492670 RepID=UPI003EBC267F
MYRWKLQELEGNMQIAASYPDDVFSQTFLKHADKMLARGKEALRALDDSEYETWTKETLEHGGFCFQDFTLARLTEIEGEPFLKELHSITCKITTAQATIIIINYMLAAGVLTLPRTVTEQIQSPDGWISILLGGVLAVIAGMIIVKLSQQYPKETFYEYSRHIVGKWLGHLISIVFITYFLALGAFEVRVTSEIVDFFLLEGTPSWAIIMT